MQIVDQAERFSLAMNGAALLYNMLLAELCVERQLLEDDRLVARYRHRLGEWGAEVRRHELSRSGWDLDDVWTVTDTADTSVPQLTRTFVEAWLRVARQVDWNVTDSREARQLVRHREQRRKGSQSRFTNERLLKQWGGASGTGRLSYRWPQVRRIRGDIADGLERAHA